MWNYNPDNDDHSGDDWNGENFSWFSQKRALPSSWLDHSQAAPTLDNGGRILRAVVRPYPAKTAGVPLRFEYEINTGEFTYEWVVPADSAVDAPSRPSVSTPPRSGMPPLRTDRTEIFVPAQLTQGRTLDVRGLAPEDKWTHDEARQTLYVRAGDDTPGRVYSIRVSLSPRLRAVFFVNDFWSDWGGTVLGVVGVVMVIWAIILTRMVMES